MSFVLGVDVGTSRIRCVAVAKDGTTLSQRETPIRVVHPTPDGTELLPEEIWQGFQKVVQDCLEGGGLSATDAKSLGITTLRNTFLLWERDTGKTLCNFISWQDRRAAQVCIDFNESTKVKVLQGGASIAHFFTRSKRFQAASVVNFFTNQVTPRLYWLLNNMEGGRERGRRGEILFGNMDTWLLWKLTDGQVHATDYSNISSTCLYDTYQLSYSSLLLGLFDIPVEMLPEVRDTGCLFGSTSEGIFGVPVPIHAIVSDQTSAAFGEMVWDTGDAKVTMGTGMFMCINTGTRPHASVKGLYPIIGWKLGDDLTFVAEGMFSSIGSVVEWGKRFGLYSDPSDTEAMAMSVESSGGVSFVPCFDGIQAPVRDPNATAAILGITHNTTPAHMVRAMLESFAFMCKALFDTADEEVEYRVNKVKIDGGVARNDFVVQLVADLLEKPVERAKELDKTVYGAVYIAGLASGFWSSRDEIREFWDSEREFLPHLPPDKMAEYLGVYERWEKALQRSLEWYN